jgi:hypothetical protein
LPEQSYCFFNVVAIYNNLVEVVMSAGPIVVEGEIKFDEIASLVRSANVYVRIEDVSRSDAPSRRIAETVIRGVRLHPEDRPSVPFYIEASLDNPLGEYVVRVHVDAGGQGGVKPGDYVTTESYPVSKAGSPAKILVTVHPVR